MRKKSDVSASLKQLIGTAMTSYSLQRAKPINDIALHELRLMIKHWPFQSGLQEIQDTKNLLDFIIIGDAKADLNTRKILKRFQEVLIMAYPNPRNTTFH